MSGTTFSSVGTASLLWSPIARGTISVNPMAKLARPLVVLSILTITATAWALQQPDGTTIPVGTSLQDLFTSRGEGISALADAATVPETYVPSCALTFEVLQRDSAYNNSFGWYNVTGSPPALSELHEFLSCTDPVGTVKALDIKNDPAYTGGEIAFYEATGPCGSLANHYNIFYSQKAYNADGSAQNPYTHMLTYNSTVTPKAFYFCWEDLLAGGDNDFNDLTTFVTGITCSGGGGACATGQAGICADGTLQCQGGLLTCLPSNQPTAEKCDGIDNDCNSLVDDGDLCPTGQVCDKGNCVHACSGNEFPCPAGKVCNASGYCVDPACVAVDCPEGKKCVAGVCVGPCDGVVCPYGQVCRVGACVDPCAAITCDPEQVCVLGACVEKCSCAGCPTGQSCQMDGTCLYDACVGKNCPTGSYCSMTGDCVDACMGAKCPAGQTCTMGACVDGGSGAGGAGGTGGSPFDTGGSPAMGSGGTPAAGGSSSGANAATAPGSGEDSRCGCRVPSPAAPLGALLALGAFVAVTAAAEVRRRSRPGKR